MGAAGPKNPKKGEAAIEASYRALADSSPDAILIHSEGRVVLANRAMLELFRIADPAAIVGREATFMLGPEHAARAQARIAALYAGQPQPRSEQVYHRPDGTRVMVEIAAAPMTLAGKPAAHVTVRDISERKRAEEDLRRFRLAMDSSADMILLIDRASMRYVDVNPAVTRLLGYSREQMLAMGPQDILPASRAALEESYDALIANPGASGSMSSHYRCADGSLLPFESTRHVLRSGEGWIIAAISRDMRERLAAERALRESEHRVRGILEGMTIGFLALDAQWRITDVNARALELTGRSAADLLGRRYLEAFPEAEGSPFELAYRRVLEARVPEQTESHFAPWNRWFEQRVDPAPGGGISIFFQEITERKLQQQRIERLSRMYAVLSGINVLIVRERDRGQLLREACRIAVEVGRFRMAWAGVVDTAARRLEVVASLGVDAAFLAVLPLALDEGPDFGLAGRAVRERRPVVVDDLATDPRVLLRAEARERGVHSAALLPLSVAGTVVGVVALHATEAGYFDESELKLLNELAGDLSFAIEHIEKSEKVDYLALYDPLTGLANRSLFSERLAQSLQSVEGRKVGVAVLDLERFKTINDSLGRQAGDALLKEVAQRLTRLGGPLPFARLERDHFTIMVAGLRAAESAARLTEQRLQDCFGPPFLINGTELRISARVGIALYPDDAGDAETLLLYAESAVKKAKEAGERYLFYTQQMTGRVAERLTLENKLRQALERGEFVLHYQPKLELESRTIAGVEALIRWQSAELGLVPPVKFIPLMEETGLILQVGAWALKQAAMDHRRWAEAGLRPPRIAVNVSPIQLRRKNFVETVEAAIDAGMQPPGIDLEITESLIMEDIEGNIGKLRRLRELGLSVAIDDFGTGYSSLAYLAKLPVQILKIDRSFIVTMLEDPDTMLLVQTIISLAHSLRLKVVAEGVETEEQSRMLRALRCDQIQGYAVSRPLPFDALSAWLADDRRK